MNQLKPMLLTSLKNYNRSQFVKDVTAGIIVAIIALPLSIALALASGVGPEAGIFTAIVAGFVISALGGSSVQIAGPTAALANHCRGDRCQKWNGRTDHCNHPCRSFSDPDGTLPLRKSDQIYSIYDHNRFYLRNRSDDRDRTVKRLLPVFLTRTESNRSRPQRN